MTRFWFRRNNEVAAPARVAEVTNLVVRQETFDRAKASALHLLKALEQWPAFDSTGNVGGAIDHTLVNIDNLDDALDDLRDQIDKHKAQELADKIAASGHPSIAAGGLVTNGREAVVEINPQDPELSAIMPKKEFQAQINRVLGTVAQSQTMFGGVEQ